MPYQIVKRDDGYYVYKEDADGRPTGEAKNSKPYASRKQATPYLRALYAASRRETITELESDRSAFEKRRDEVYAKYHDLVNMSATELENWADSDASKRASLDRSPIKRNLRLLRKNKDEWTPADVADAGRTISFISRMRRVKGGKPVNQDIAYSKKEISLRNWAYKVAEMEDGEDELDDDAYEDDELMSQADAQYVTESVDPAHRCGNCRFFSEGACAVVAGEPEPIGEMGACEHWMEREFEMNGDGEAAYPFTPSLNPYPLSEFSTRDVRADEIVREFEIGSFRGKYPDVPFAPTFDLEAIKQGDAKPFFVTLPIFEIGKVSDNKLRYTREFCESIVRGINEGGKVGIRGHIPKEKLTTDYPLPAVYWVGATIVGNRGWGKFYVPPGEHREHYRVLVNAGGEEAVSIYGKPTRIYEYADGTYTPELPDFQLDLAPPDRASLKFEDRRFYVTSEMEGENPMSSEVDMRQVLAEMTDDALMEMMGEDRVSRMTEMYAKKKNRKLVAMEMQAFPPETIAEYEQNVTRRDDQIAELTDTVNDQRTLIAELRQKMVAGALDAAVDEVFIEWNVKTEKGKRRLAELKKTIREGAIAEMGDEADDAKVADAVRASMTANEWVVEMARDALAGGSAAAGSDEQRGSGRTVKLPTQEEIEEARAKLGV